MAYRQQDRRYPHIG